MTIPAGFPGGVVGDVISTHNRNIQLVTVGVNYLFNWGAGGGYAGGGY